MYAVLKMREGPVVKVHTSVYFYSSSPYMDRNLGLVQAELCCTLRDWLLAYLEFELFVCTHAYTYMYVLSLLVLLATA